MMKKKEFLFLIPAILFFVVLLIKLFQLSKMIYFFPSYDFSSHLTNLYFLKNYGFHNIAPNWYFVYGGDYVLQFYPPGVFFFSLILYNFMNNLQFSFYISFILLHLLGFLGILIFGRIIKFSYIKIFLLFSFFYANPLAIPWFYFNGRLPEMFAWTLSFYLLSLIFYYKNKKLNLKFYTLLTLLSSILILAHPSITLLFFIFLFGFFLLRSKQEKIYISFSLFFSFLLTSFWWIDFIIGYFTVFSYYPSYRIYTHPTEVIYSILIPFLFLFVFLLYLKFKKQNLKETFIFYSPLIIISLIYSTHIFLKIPFLKSIEPRSYGIFLLFFLLFFLLKLKMPEKSEKFYSFLILIFLILISLASFVRYYESPGFTLYDEEFEGILKLLPQVKNNFIVIGEKSYEMHHVYSFAVVKYNLTTPFGWDIQDYQEKVNSDKTSLKNSINEQNCLSLFYVLNKLNVMELIVYKDKCEFLKNCGLIEVDSFGNYCHLLKEN